jgi:hypothetical protein
VTTRVFSTARLLHSKPALVCQLQDLKPDEAIARLEASGVLAIEGPEPDSIVLLGFSYEVSQLVTDFRRYGKPYHPQACAAFAKIRRFSLAG